MACEEKITPSQPEPVKQQKQNLINIKKKNSLKIFNLPEGNGRALNVNDKRIAEVLLKENFGSLSSVFSMSGTTIKYPEEKDY